MNNIFTDSAKSLGKILMLIALAYVFLAKIVFAENAVQLGIGLFVLIFVTLPTVYLFFFYQKFPKLAKVWKIYRFFYYFFIVLYIAAFIAGAWHLSYLDKTQKAIDFINSKKITLEDVMGKNLPPKPDQTLNDSTIAGIDANNNYIRDDVELEIFAKYPDNPKIREAMLQYAQALQLELTQVYNSETLVAILQKRSSAQSCIDNTGSKANFAIADDRIKEVEQSEINTDLRLKKQASNLEKYMTTYSTSSAQECDIEIK
jgi:hypothetical protein